MKFLFMIFSLIGVMTPLKSESFKEVDCDFAMTQYEMNVCSSRSLYKNDLKLKQEIEDNVVFEKWISGREAVCKYYSGKQFNGGSIRPMMQNGCNLRLNSEAKRFCLTSDPQCG